MNKDQAYFQLNVTIAVFQCGENSRMKPKIELNFASTANVQPVS